MSLFKHVSYFLLPLPLAAASAAEHRAIRVGYAECAGFLPQSSQQGAKLKWYFAHASVGANMVDGLNDLNKKDGGTYPYTTFFCDKAPPAETKSDMVYEHNRGNPGWKAKFDQFESCVSNGWHFPKVDVVMNKLCYIDQLASFKYYIRSMTNLEAAFPDTVFVYMTMPLTTAEDADNGLRNGFNDQVPPGQGRMDGCCSILPISKHMIPKAGRARLRGGIRPARNCPLNTRAMAGI
jgi:hypothetical protein